MKYDFETVINREGTSCLKYDCKEQRGYEKDVLPLWVADMDFQTAPEILEAVEDVAKHGIYGYTAPQDDYFDAVKKWFQDHYAYHIEKDWIIFTPGVVYAVAMAVRAYTEPGDKVLIQTPVYYPFYHCIEENHREIVKNPLVYKDGTYEIDFDDFERKIVENDVKLFILCSPHNPVGRVWTEEELKKMGEIVKKYGVIVVSDEIHCDFAFPEYPHTVFTNANPDLMDQAIVCTAPSKSFNLAGLTTSNIIIADRKLRTKFLKQINEAGGVSANPFGLAACTAAYEKGQEWLDEVRVYMRDNLDYLRDYLSEHLPEIKLVEPEGTYFAWLDCSGLGLSDKELNDLIVKDAKLWLDAGNIFGPEGEQFERIVLASPRAILTEALTRLEKAVHARQA